MSGSRPFPDPPPLPELDFPLTGEDKWWNLGDLNIGAVLYTPEDNRRWQEYWEQNERHNRPIAVAPQEVAWTAAQVAATTGALSAYVASAARKWRDKRLKLPEGTRLTLTLSPAKGDHRRRAQVIITDIHMKTPDEITHEIRNALRAYAAGDSGS
jgi:hypothetical protein